MIEQFKKIFRLSEEALWRHKLRSLLTILGITVGIAVVIVVLSAGQAIEQFITSQVTTFGTDWVEVEVKVPSAGKTSFENAGGIAQGITITTLTLDDAKAIDKLPNVKNFYVGNAGQEVASYQDKNKIVTVFGVSASFIDIDAGEIAEGRFYTDSEENSLAKVIVLGSNIKQSLFGDADALNQKVKINRQNYRVIGVMANRGSAGLFSMDDMVFMPNKTMQKLVLGIDYVSFIFLQLQDNSLAQQTADDITLLMRDRHNITDPIRDDFAVTTSQEALDILGTVTGAIKLLLLAIALISLIVGGVGIMNVMYVSVSERTFEIGLRKAVGAKYSNILNQFLTEAIITTFIGGLVGVAMGVGISYLISYVATNFLGFDWPFYISISYILLAVGMSVLVGIFAGLYPARQAAALDPIVSLRQE